MSEKNEGGSLESRIFKLKTRAKALEESLAAALRSKEQILLEHTGLVARARAAEEALKGQNKIQAYLSNWVKILAKALGPFARSITPSDGKVICSWRDAEGKVNEFTTPAAAYLNAYALLDLLTVGRKTVVENVTKEKSADAQAGVSEKHDEGADGV